MTVPPSSSSPATMADAKSLLQLKEQEIASLRESALQQLEHQVSILLFSRPCNFPCKLPDEACASSCPAAGFKRHRAGGGQHTGKM